MNMLKRKFSNLKLLEKTELSSEVTFYAKRGMSDLQLYPLAVHRVKRNLCVNILKTK